MNWVDFGLGIWVGFILGAIIVDVYWMWKHTQILADKERKEGVSQ